MTNALVSRSPKGGNYSKTKMKEPPRTSNPTLRLQLQLLSPPIKLARFVGISVHCTPTAECCPLLEHLLKGGFGCKSQNLLERENFPDRVHLLGDHISAATICPVGDRDRLLARRSWRDRYRFETCVSCFAFAWLTQLVLRRIYVLSRSHITLFVDRFH